MFRGQHLFRTANEYVRLYTDGTKFLGRVLRRLGLDLGRCRDIRHQRQMHIDDPIVPELDAHLSDRLQKRQRFDVTYRTTDFNQTDIGIASTFLDTFLDFISDVRDDLYSRTEVVAPPFLGNDALVNPASREIAVPSGSCADESLVVAEIEIRLGAVFSYEYLAVLERAHRARVDVEVGIQLDHADRQSA